MISISISIKKTLKLDFHSDWSICAKWNWKLHTAQSLGAWMGVTQDQVGSLLWMIRGMSSTHHHTTVTADQANGNEREHCNPFRKSGCTTFVKVSLLLPLHHCLSKALLRQVQTSRKPGEKVICSITWAENLKFKRILRTTWKIFYTTAAYGPIITHVAHLLHK